MNSKMTVLDVFTPEECASITEEVFKLTPYLLDRGHFWTLGASAYLDDPLKYPAMANAFNLVLAQAFGKLYTRVYDAITAHLGQPIVGFKFGLAVPGFHVFDHTSNGHQGLPHIDEPYTRVDFTDLKWHTPFSFTLPVCIPTAGAGADFWFNAPHDCIERYAVNYSVPEPEFIPYELGRLYIHDGHTPHKIASVAPIPEGENRVTLQGHGVHTDDGVLLYF